MTWQLLTAAAAATAAALARQRQVNSFWTDDQHRRRRWRRWRWHPHAHQRTRQSSLPPTACRTGAHRRHTSCRPPPAPSHTHAIALHDAAPIMRHRHRRRITSSASVHRRHRHTHPPPAPAPAAHGATRRATAHYTHRRQTSAVDDSGTGAARRSRTIDICDLIISHIYARGTHNLSISHRCVRARRHAARAATTT